MTIILRDGGLAQLLHGEQTLMILQPHNPLKQNPPTLGIQIQSIRIPPGDQKT